MKFTLTALFCISFLINSPAQSLYCKSETDIKGLPSFIAKNAKATTYAYHTKNKLKTETTTMNSTQINIVDENGATVLNKIGSDKNCGKFTRQEMEEDSLDLDVVTTDVVIVKTNETKKLLGYACKKIVITYKVVQMVSLDCEMILWCTEEIKAPNTSHLPELNKRNALTTALSSLNAFPLLTEVIMKSNRVRTITTVTEVNTKEISETVFTLDQNDCKKPLNLKEYKAMLLKRQHQAQMMGR